MIVLAAPVMGPLAYGAHAGMLQVLGFLLVFVGSIPAARVMFAERGERAARFHQEAPARHPLAQRMVAGAAV
jgi:hypothetical protein